VWRRWRSRTRERRGRDTVADQPGCGAGWAQARIIWQDGSRASMLRALAPKKSFGKKTA